MTHMCVAVGRQFVADLYDPRGNAQSAPGDFNQIRVSQRYL